MEAGKKKIPSLNCDFKVLLIHFYTLRSCFDDVGDGGAGHGKVSATRAARPTRLPGAGNTFAPIRPRAQLRWQSPKEVTFEGWMTLKLNPNLMDEATRSQLGQGVKKVAVLKIETIRLSRGLGKHCRSNT